MFVLCVFCVMFVEWGNGVRTIKRENKQGEVFYSISFGSHCERHST